MKKKKAKDSDWRKRPRKPAAMKRSAGISVKVTEDELATIKENAERADMTLADYVVTRALGKRSR